MVEPKILIIADDPEVRNQLLRSLGGSGAQTFAVPGSEQSFLQFGLFLPELVIVDIPLHSKDRWKTIQRVREMSSVPIIALISVKDRQGRSESLDYGADSCLTKPYHASELQARIRALLRRVRYTAQSAR